MGHHPLTPALTAASQAGRRSSLTTAVMTDDACNLAAAHHSMLIFANLSNIHAIIVVIVDGIVICGATKKCAVNPPISFSVGSSMAVCLASLGSWPLFKNVFINSSQLLKRVPIVICFFNSYFLLTFVRHTHR